MLIVSEKKRCVSVFGPFSVPKTVHFNFSQPVLGCTFGVHLVCISFGVHFIATKVNLLLVTSFVYPLLVGAAKNGFICFFVLAANLQHFGTKKQCLALFWLSVHGCIVLFGVKSIFLKGNALLATSFVVLMLIVSDKNSSKSVFGPFWYKKQCILLFRLNVMDFTQFSPNQQCTGCKNNLLKVQNTLLRHFL